MAEQREDALVAYIDELRAALARVEAERDEYRAILCEIREGSLAALADDSMKRLAEVEARCRQLEDALLRLMRECFDDGHSRICMALSSPLPAPPQEPER